MKRTALYDEHIALGARMVPFAGFEMPVQYEGVNAEHLNVRQNVGLFDVSHMGNFFVSGKDAGNFLQYVTSNDVSKLFPGKVQYSTLTNEHGGIVDDLLVYMLDENRYMLVVNAANIAKDFGHLQQYTSRFGDVQLDNRSDDWSIIAVQGPKSPELIQRLVDEPIQDMKFYTHRQVNLAGIENVLISTTGYTGEKGWEIYTANKHAAKIWRALLDAGKDLGVKPAGLGARDTLRLEKGYCLYGNDINDNTTPLEAGLGWITKLQTDFVGVDVLRRQKEEGLTHRLTGFEITGRGIPRHGYPIENEKGQVIGEVTSGTMSPSLKKGIGMGYVPPELAANGSEIFIRIRNKSIPARTLKMPVV